jgi:hypothetical protein
MPNPQSYQSGLPASAKAASLFRKVAWAKWQPEDYWPTELALLDLGTDFYGGGMYRRPAYHLPYKARRGRPLTDAQTVLNAYLSRYRSVVEHSGLTRIVAGLVNRRIAQRPLKTYAAV